MDSSGEFEPCFHFQVCQWEELWLQCELEWNGDLYSFVRDYTYVVLTQIEPIFLKYPYL
jgi:hypothetical protein